MQKLKNKVALVTGGSRGIGAEIVRQLAGQGAIVSFTYAKAADRANELTEELAASEIEVFPIRADNAIEGEIGAAAKTVFDKFGRLDILINNAGVYLGKPMEAHTLADYNLVMNVNVRAVVETAIFAAAKMADQGRIITIGSNMADRVTAPEGTLYAMSKAALIGLTKGLARDLGSRGITVNLVQPGPVNTEMNPADSAHADYLRSLMAIPKYGAPEQIAELVSYLVSPSASFTTGSVMTIDGGFSI